MLLYGCARYSNTPGMDIDAQGIPVTDKSIKIPEKNNILQELSIDIDLDNFKESIIIDLSPDEFARLLIFKNENCVFNSSKNGIEIQKDFLEYTDGDFLSVSDSNNNQVPEIYFTVCGDGIQPDGLAIIENYEVLFFKPMTGYEYIDLDSDGTVELCGCTNWGGQVTFNYPECSVFKYNFGNYNYSEELTIAYYQELCLAAENDFKAEENCENLQWLISLYAKVGDHEKGEYLIKKYVHLLNDGDDQYDIDFFMTGFEMRLAENGY